MLLLYQLGYPDGRHNPRIPCQMFIGAKLQVGRHARFEDFVVGGVGQKFYNFFTNSHRLVLNAYLARNASIGLLASRASSSFFTISANSTLPPSPSPLFVPLA